MEKYFTCWAGFLKLYALAGGAKGCSQQVFVFFPPRRTKKAPSESKITSFKAMNTQAILSCTFVFAMCLARGTIAAQPHQTEVNVGGWLHLSESDRGWQIEGVRELGNWNVPLRDGDLVTQIEGQNASKLGPVSIAALLEDAMLQKIPVTVERRGQLLKLDLFTGEEEEDAEAKRFYTQYGVGLMLTSSGTGSAVTVHRVTPNSPAEKSGLHKDDRIIAVEGKEVSTFTVSQVSELLLSDRPSPVKLRVRRENAEFEVTINRVLTRELFQQPEAALHAFPIHQRGDPAPTFELMSTKGKRVRLEDFRGKWVLLNFWGVWCAPCHFELPFLEAWSKEYSRNLVVLGLDVNDKPDSLARYLARNPIAYDILLAGQIGDPPAKSYAVRGVPVNVIVDPNGVVRYVELGFEPPSPTAPPPLQTYLRSIQR
jgi:thiol-disulfide isomerase/thioredoxin